MLELLIEFDYQTIRQTLLAAYIMTIVFPIAACYFFHKQGTLLNDKYQASFEAKQELMPIPFIVSLIIVAYKILYNRPTKKWTK